jgi:hypothetical protein
MSVCAAAKGKGGCSLVLLLQPFGSLHRFSLLVEVLVALRHRLIKLDSHLPVLLPRGPMLAEIKEAKPEKVDCAKASGSQL